MGFRIPGPECQVRNWFAEPLDPGTTAQTTHKPPKTAGHRVKHRRKKHKVPSVAFHPKNLVGFLHSVARAKSMAKHFSLVYQEPKDQSWYEKVAIPGGERILTVSFGGSDAAGEKKIEDDAHQNYKDLVVEFKRRLSNGPESVRRFMEEQERDRQRHVNLIADMYGKVNPEHNRWATQILAELVLIKLAGTIAWKVAGDLVEKPIFIALDLGRDLTIELLNNWEDLGKAKVILLVICDVAQAVQEKLADAQAEKLAEWADETTRLEFFNKVFADAEKFLKEDFDKRLNANMAHFKKAMRPVRAWKIYGKAFKSVVKIGWLAKNIREAIVTAGEDWGKAQENE